MNLEQLRRWLASLQARATALPGQITDGMAPDAARAIEQEHAAVLAEIETVQARIAELERAADDEEDEEEDEEERGGDGAAGGDIAEQVRQAVEAELRADRERIGQIRDIARRHGMDDAFVAHQVAAGADIDAVRTAVLEALATRSQQTPIFGHVQLGGQDEADTRRRGMRDAIAVRLARAAGERNVQVPEHARAFAERELIDLAAECIGYRGLIRTPRQMTEVMQRAFHTTSDFPAIFTDALNIRLLARYQAAAPTYRLFASRYTTPDFRETKVIRAGDFPALQPVNEAGEIKSGTFSESKEGIQTKPYGVKLSFTRQMIINDQLGAIDQVLNSAGERVTDWENALVYALLVSGSGAGPVLVTDNKRVFHADHGNLASPGTAIDVTNIGKGRAAMSKQTTLDGIKANFLPRTLLVGPDKLTEAEQLLTAITPAQQSNAIPESLRRLIPVSDANLTGNVWYLFADPAIAPVFHYSYLEGYEAPRLTFDDVFDVQGMRVKLEHDFGAAATDYRGGYRNPGA